MGIIAKARWAALRSWLVLVTGFAVGGGQAAFGQEGLETDWVAAQANKARARLSAGSQGGQDLALIEIELEPGWKTYWRNPGEAGLPPEFKWDGSTNIASAEPLFPAPHRFIDKAGETIGYKERVIFPVKLTRGEAGKAATLVAEVQYGVCKEICIPAEAKLALTLPQGPWPEITGDVLSDVPREQTSLKPGDPVIERAEAVLGGADPRIEIEIRVPAGTDSVTAFLAAEGGVYVPSPELSKDLGSGRTLFVAKLGEGIDLAALKARTMTVTAASSKGASTRDVIKTP